MQESSLGNHRIQTLPKLRNMEDLEEEPLRDIIMEQRYIRNIGNAERLRVRARDATKHEIFLRDSPWSKYL